ncbi:MAG: YhdH/YhfP family quinone oxidoreductase [Bdellovibrionales bacterium]|nr:YhdH/YhfP family quinone oxidoreductase [Bdellovibrionales bacterium]
MKDLFLALWAQNSTQDPNQFPDIQCELRETRIDELSEGDVVVDVHYSGINFKDALAVCGKGKILRSLPLIPGIDMAGVVSHSKSTLWQEGDSVFLNGNNLGETITGGFSQKVRIAGDRLLALPKDLSLKEAMIYGTAGFTAALALNRLEHNGLTPNKGKVLVTGATGGVGSLALGFLKKRGYECEAWTRRLQHKEWLTKCGASEVTDISGYDFKAAPLAKAIWAGAIDNLGGEALSYILPHMDLWSSVASIGLAQNENLNTTVFPFILRGVNLLGTSSNNCPLDLKKAIWQQMATTYKPENLSDWVFKEIGLEDIEANAEQVLSSLHHGRILINLKD